MNRYKFSLKTDKPFLYEKGTLIKFDNKGNHGRVFSIDKVVMNQLGYVTIIGRYDEIEEQEN